MCRIPLISKHRHTSYLIKQSFVRLARSFLKNSPNLIKILKIAMDKINPETSFKLVYDATVKFLFQIILENKTTSLASSLATLFTNDEKTKTRWTRLFGLLSFEFDRRCKSHFLRLYDLDSLDIRFQCELYYGFDENYREIGPQTHAFDFYGGSIGVGFRNKQEAEKMLSKIKYEAPKRQDQAKTPKEAHNPFSKASHKIFTSQSKQQPTKIINTTHNAMVFNPTKGNFDIEHIAPEINEILTNIGITKQQLQNRESAEVIFQQIVINSVIHEAEQNHQLREQLENTLKKTLVFEKENSLQYSQKSILDSVRDGSNTQKDPLKQQLMKEIQSGNLKVQNIELDQGNVVIKKSESKDWNFWEFIKGPLAARYKALHPS